MSIKREDERYNGDTVEQLRDLFDNDPPPADDGEQPDDGRAGDEKQEQRRAPRMRITGDLRDPRRGRH